MRQSLPFGKRRQPNSSDRQAQAELRQTSSNLENEKEWLKEAMQKLDERTKAVSGISRVSSPYTKFLYVVFWTLRTRRSPRWVSSFGVVICNYISWLQVDFIYPKRCWKVHVRASEAHQVFATRAARPCLSDVIGSESIYRMCKCFLSDSMTWCGMFILP